MNKFCFIFFVGVLLTVLPITSQELKKDSLDIKIGQMLMLGIGNITETDTSDVILKSVSKGHLGGILLYEKNISKNNSSTTLKNLIATYKNNSEIPLLVSIDEEGGIVNRLKPKYGFPKTVTAKYLGDLNSIDSTKHYSDLIAHNLYLLGINVNYAPVIDLHNSENPAIGKNKRSFSMEPEIVIKHAREVVKSHRYFGVKTVLKHFPGQGNANKDSHYNVTDVSNTWKEEELFPYLKLMYEGNVDAIMTAHIVNKNLDDEKFPATLSKKILKGYLRNQLGYDGVIFSDDMQMRAISDHFGFETAIKMAILAGVDILMFSNHIYSRDSKLITAEDLIAVIKKMVNDKEITEDRIDASYRRIMIFKKTLY
ncbi:glycoside hydrolase family 3 N-terminal domain-containing protein [Ascidiimonas sp. W6]|uniref:glycoside hydrolase family 3 N-terminal domain-containing protein n=1 Tax=Ascidiimonas meishanensis TaxID=3128903 RepID=UPI0030EE7D7D